MKNIFPVSRAQHDAVRASYANLDDVYRAQSATLESLTLQVQRQAENLAAIASERDAAQHLARRALVMVHEVNTTRYGGQSYRERRDALNADAKEHGLWPRTQEEEE